MRYRVTIEFNDNDCDFEIRGTATIEVEAGSEVDASEIAEESLDGTWILGNTNVLSVERV